MGLFDIFFGGKYKSNTSGSRVPERRMAALNIGAINSEQTQSYCDSLSTGLKLKSLAGNLSSAYDIVNRDSALETLEWLKERGHRYYFEAIKGLVAGDANSIDETILSEEELPNTFDYINNLNSTLEQLIEEKFIQQKGDLRDCSILAWDMGRLVFVARCCYDMGYVSENEAWDYIDHAHQACTAVYNSWRELANGYIIGRCMWSGESMMLPGLMGISKDLLKDKNSPWVQYKFN